MSRLNNIVESYFPEDEMTKYGFISHMEAYIKQLLSDPIHAKVDDYLEKHGIDSPKALKILLKRNDPNNERSAILIRTTKIRPEELSEEDAAENKTPKDAFCVKYKLPREGYSRKMARAFVENCENTLNEETVNEDGDGATNCSSSGQFVQPLFGQPIRRKSLYITEKQKAYIKKVIDEEAVMNTAAGDFGYDVPALAKKGDPTMDHQDMMKKSWEGR